MKTATLTRPSLQRTLETHLDNALQGRSSIILVTGDAGSGKTQLIQQFSREAQSKNSELIVAYAACNSITGVADAYMPFREILQQLSGDVDESLAEGFADPGNVSRVSRFMHRSARALVENGPDLVDVFVPGGALLTRLGGKVAQRFTWFDKLAKQVEIEKPRHISTELKQENIFEQYTRVIEVMSEEAPLLLIVDDLHWSDQASLGLLFQLARRLVNNPVLIIAATRPHDDSANMHQLSNLVSELQRYYGDIVLDLSAQPEGEFVTEYLDALGIDAKPTTVDLLVKQTSGNPLFVVELLRQFTSSNDIDGFLQDVVTSQLPAKLTGIFERMFRALDDQDQQALVTASVQGFEFWAELVSDIQGETPLTTLRRLGGKLQRERNIIVDAGPLDLASGTVSRFTFRHELLREFVYQTPTENERRILHKMVADQIEQRTIESTEEYCLMLADQFEKARDWSKALRYRVMAAERMEIACAPIETASHYLTAVEMCSKISPVPETTLFDLRLRLTSQLTLAGEFRQAEEIADAALASAADTGQESNAWLAIGGLSRRQRGYDKALHALSQAESVLPVESKSEGDWKRVIDVLLERAIIHYLQRDDAELAQTNQALEELIEVHGAPSQQVSFFGSRSRQALMSSKFSPNHDAITFSEKAVECAQPSSPGSIFGLAFATLWYEKFEAAIKLLQKAELEARRHGDSTVRLQALIYSSFAQRRLGNVSAVEELVAQISAVLELVKMPEYPAVLSAQQSWLAFRRGDAGDAATLAQAAIDYWEEKTSPYPFRWIANWVRFAVSQPGSVEAMAAANSMLSSGQAWQRENVVAALKRYLSDSETAKDQHELVIEIAQQETYL